MKFGTTIDIEATPEHVWSVMSDIERWREWTESVTSIEKLNPGPLRVGSRARIRQPGLPPNVWEVTELSDARNFTWTTRSPGVRVTACHVIMPTTSGSRVSLSMKYSGLLSPLVGRVFHRLTERNLAFEASGLKRRCEESLAQTA